MSEPQQFFFVLANVSHGNSDSISGYMAKEGDWPVANMDDPEIKVFRTPKEAMDCIFHDEQRILKVHREFIAADALPE